MSSAKAASEPQAAEGSDLDMMEAPDSPPSSISCSRPHKPPKYRTPNKQQTPRTNCDAKVNFGAPGSSWQTKKSNDEYERAESQLLDRQWDHTKYGDP